MKAGYDANAPEGEGARWSESPGGARPVTQAQEGAERGTHRPPEEAGNP